MDMISAIRTLCKGEIGFVNMFDQAKSQGKLSRLTEGHPDAILFETMLYGQAKSALVELLHDSCNFKAYITWTHSLLIEDGMTADEAKRTLDYFFTAFGFPGYRIENPASQRTITEEDCPSKYVYCGEVLGDMPHGVGKRDFFYEGEWSSCNECVWIYGVMCGYDHAREIEFDIYEDQKIGFVVNDCFVGKVKCLYDGGEESWEQGITLDIS